MILVTKYIIKNKKKLVEMDIKYKNLKRINNKYLSK